MFDNIGCLILAAGIGKRFGKKKQFIEWKGIPLYQHVVNRCKEITNNIYIIGVDFPGGDTRQESVRLGLSEVKESKVIILEAARPLIQIEQILTIGKLENPSISFYEDSTDTIIQDGKHLDRKKTKKLQVPQAFNTGMLKEAHLKTSHTNATDDTILMMEIFSIPPLLIKGGSNLFKVTYPQDIEILEVLCRY